MYCSECGAKVIEGSKFCSSCGKRLTGVSAFPERMGDEAVVATSKPKTEGKRPLWRRVLGDRERTALRCVLGIVMWVGIMLVGEILTHLSSGYIDMRTSEYVAKYGRLGLSGMEWLTFGIGIVLNVAGIAMVCCWLLALLSRIRPANCGKSTKAKVVAVVVCIMFCFGFGLLRWYGNGCKPCFSIWDGIILYAVCSAVWRGLVGKASESGNEHGATAMSLVLSEGSTPCFDHDGRGMPAHPCFEIAPQIKHQKSTCTDSDLSKKDPYMDSSKWTSKFFIRKGWKEKQQRLERLHKKVAFWS